MEVYEAIKIEEGYRIEGLPTDAIRIVKIDNSKDARSLSDLILHREDLSFARECLDEIDRTDNALVREALWRSAITHFCKCFGNNRGRADYKLIANKIYPEEGLMALRYFKELRHKHIVHDENSFSQSITGAAINNGNKQYKIEKIVTFAGLVQTLCQENWSNLGLLIGEASEWVEKEYDALCGSLSEELEKRGYKDLCSLKDIHYKKPELEDTGNKRHKD